MDVLFAILGFLGPVGLTGLWIFVMINKYGWKLVQVLAGGLFFLLLVSYFPQMPQGIHNGVVSITNSFSK